MSAREAILSISHSHPPPSTSGSLDDLHAVASVKPSQVPTSATASPRFSLTCLSPSLSLCPPRSNFLPPLFFFFLSVSSWKGRTARGALSTACAAIAAPTQTHRPAPFPPCPLCPLRRWQLRPQCRLLRPSPSQACPRWIRPQMAPFRRNQILSRSGRSPGACTRAEVSNVNCNDKKMFVVTGPILPCQNFPQRGKNKEVKRLGVKHYQGSLV